MNIKKLIIVFSFVVIIEHVKAQTDVNIEMQSYVSNAYCDTVQDVATVRPLNSGSVIIPNFTSSCPEDMKGAFSYACKILEEYLPPSLPINVSVSCANLGNGQQSPVSRVVMLSKDGFGRNQANIHPRTLIKGVILGELGYESTVSFLDFVPNKAFLLEEDIRIIYNSQRLSEISFSIDTEPGNKYDFVTLALRDLLKGFGFICRVTANTSNQTIDFSTTGRTFYEDRVIEALTRSGCESLYQAATSGEVAIVNSISGLKLYAPASWNNALSLNSFVPRSESSISNILSYDFGKGTVARSLDDNLSDNIFTRIIGWEYNYTTSSTAPVTTYSGSTSLLMPYYGNLTIDSENYSISGESTEADTENENMQSYSINSDYQELSDYVNSFKPFIVPVGSNATQGVSVSILKKDGTWDLVFFLPVYVESYPMRMNEWTFHCANEDYARTADGYLRARITTSQQNNLGRYVYRSCFFAVDYLPQVINVSYTLPESSTASSTYVATQNVRLHFSNLEGLNRVVLERLRKGASLPTKTTIYDFKDGYYDTTINRETTFTAVGYNDNGYTRSVPVTVTMPVESSSGLSLDYSDGVVNFVSEEGGEMSIEYTIVNIGNPNGSTLSSGVTDGNVDISSLPSGIYVVKALDLNSGKSYSFKVRK